MHHLQHLTREQLGTTAWCVCPSSFCMHLESSHCKQRTTSRRSGRVKDAAVMEKGACRSEHTWASSAPATQEAAYQAACRRGLSSGVVSCLHCLDIRPACCRPSRHRSLLA